MFCSNLFFAFFSLWENGSIQPLDTDCTRRFEPLIFWLQRKRDFWKTISFIVKLGRAGWTSLDVDDLMSLVMCTYSITVKAGASAPSSGLAVISNWLFSSNVSTDLIKLHADRLSKSSHAINHVNMMHLLPQHPLLTTALTHTAPDAESAPVTVQWGFIVALLTWFTSSSRANRPAVASLLCVRDQANFAVDLDT